jgi:alpha-beta hydrolase superfamily lysophospholipase
MNDHRAAPSIEELAFTADGFKLRGTLHRPDHPRPPVVIGCHGLLSDRRSPKQLALAEACTALGMAYFRFDHRGCGDSAGRLEEVTSLEARCRDLRAAKDLLTRRSDLGRRFGLFGSSMGGAVCLRTASRFRAAAVVSYAAPLRSRALFSRQRGSGGTREASVLKAGFDLGRQLARVGRILVVHGEADAVVPFAHALEIMRKAKAPKRLIAQKGGDHPMSDPAHQRAFLAEAAAWFRRFMTGSPSR